MFRSKTGQDVSLVKYGHSHGELHRAIKGRGEASSAASPEEKALASEPAPEAPRIPSSSSVAFFLKLFSSCWTCPASYSAISCIRLTADHSNHRSPRLHLAPGCPLDRMHATESDGPRHFAIPKRAKRKGKMAGQRGPIAPTQGVPPSIDDVNPSSLDAGAGGSSSSISGIKVDESGREVADFGDGASDLEDEQSPAAEAKPMGPDTSAIMARNEEALCQQRLEKLLPEVEQGRAAVKAATEALRITREALDRKWVKLELEQSQQRARYEQERDLELEREEMAIRDAEEKVKGLEDDYRAYKNRKAAAQARLRGLTPTGSTDTGQSPSSSRPSAAPASPVLPGDPTDDPPYLDIIGAKFSEFRKLQESHPDMTVKEFAELKLYFDAKPAASRRRDSADRSGRARPPPESARSDAPRRQDSHRVERHQRGRDSRERHQRGRDSRDRHQRGRASRERHPRDRPSTGPR